MSKLSCYFITAIDTGVGKTILTAGLAQALNERGHHVGLMKPIIAGDSITAKNSDTQILSRSINHTIPSELITPIALKLPQAPFIAAKIARQDISITKILSIYQVLKNRFNPLLVEGVGGLLVPIMKAGKKFYYVTDLVKAMKLPLIIVTHPYLGTINHTLLTIREARRSGIKIAGLVINHCQGKPRKGGKREARLLRETLQDEGRVKILGEVPYLGKRFNIDRVPLKPFTRILARLRNSYT
ncbi:dethiobiotin synthase [Planctomycetota bacterium]